MPETVSNSVSYGSIPTQLSECRFIKLGYHSKTPAAGQKGHFKSDENSFGIDDSEIIQHIKSGANYGILPRNDILIIDCDNLEMWNLIPDAWKETFTVITGRDNGTGRHLYLKSKDAPTSSKIIFPEDMGDIRLSGHNSYVVGPYSVHPDSGKQYLPANDNEIIEVSWVDLSAFIEANKGAVKKSTTQEQKEKKIIAAREYRKNGNTKISDTCDIQVIDWIYPNNPRIVGNTIMGANPVFGSRNGFNLHIDTQKNIFYDWYNHTGGDGLIAFCISKGLIEFKDAGPNCLKEIWAQVFLALEAEGFVLGNSGMDAKIAKDFLKYLAERRANNDQ